MKSYLEFERDVKVLEEELEKLKDPFNKEGLSEVETEKISKIQGEIDEKLKVIYNSLDQWQTTQIARLESRPKSKYIIDNVFTNFINLSGDRHFSEDRALVSGFAELEGRSVLVLGQEKGTDLDSRLDRNFGMMRPEGYHTAIRLQKLANKFNIPVITLIDSAGAFPSIGSENRGIAHAISSSINTQMSLKVPIISVILGEGGSGGAIAMASANKVIMAEHAIFTTISPEGCASILWRDPSKSLEAAKAMKLTAKDLLKMQIVDEIIPEPIPAHRNREQFLLSIKEALIRNLDEFKKYTGEEIFEQRREKFLGIGKQKSFKIFSTRPTWIRKDDFFATIKKILFKFKKELIIAIILIFAAFLFLF